MIGKIFEISGGKIIPKQDCEIIEPIRILKEKYPKDYGKIIAFLHYMNSMNPSDNPYADVPLNIREEKILRELKLDIDTQAPEIQDALKCVEEMYYTTFYGVYKGMKIMLDNIGQSLANTEIDFTVKDGNASNIIRLMKDYEDIRKSFKVAFKDYEEEMSGVRVRGGIKLADDEDEDY